MTRIRITLWVGLVIAAVAPHGASAEVRPERSLAAVRRIAVQHSGRHKPFDSFAREALQTITGSPRWKGADPLETVLDIMAHPDRWEAEALVAVPFVPLREPLGLGPKATHISYAQLVSTRKLMRMLPAIVAKQDRDEKLTVLDNETMDVFQRFVTLSGLLEQKLELVPPPSGTGNWLPIHEPAAYPADQQQAFSNAWMSFLDAARRRDPAAIESQGRQLAERLERANPAAYPAPWRRTLEVWQNRVQPLRWARWLYWITCAALLFGLIRQAPAASSVGLGAFALAAVVHASGILIRVVLGGRPPVSNFFETMLWLPFVTVVLSLVFERIYRARYIALAGSVLAAITLTLTDYVPLDSSISPVVAVLRSNLWLTIHVLTIVASYGAIALAAALAHVYGWLYMLRGPRHAPLRGLATFLYRAIQVGVVLLAGGIMLGAVWANASWGRYWGWDPKETWALITLLWYLAMLHGRFAGWIRGVGLALGTIGGFFLLLMTYYGVSFYLVGLHSYAGGHAKPLPVALVAYVLLESCFLAALGARALRRRAI